MRISCSSGCLAVLVALSLPASAWATQVIGLDVKGLTDGSDAIVVGRVVRADSRWTRDGRLIVTEVEVTVAEALKGSPAKSVVILQPGGVVGDVGQVVSGLARFGVGDEVLVFLERQGRRTFLVTGLAQGKFRIERTSDGTQAFAVPDDVGEAALVDPLTRAPMRSPLRPMALEDLKREIAARVKVQPTRRRAEP